MTSAGHGHVQGHDECYACPVGSFFAGVQSAQPEALDHLLNAAYELLEVARAAIDAAEGAIDQQRAARNDRDPARGDQRERVDRPERATTTSRAAAGARRRVHRIDIA